MAKNPNSRVGKAKSVKKDQPMNGAMKFFLAGLVAELYLMIVRRFYVSGTLEQVVAWDGYLKIFGWIGVAALALGIVLSLIWKSDKKKRIIGWSVTAAGGFLVGFCSRRIITCLKCKNQAGIFEQICPLRREKYG